MHGKAPANEPAACHYLKHKHLRESGSCKRPHTTVGHVEHFPEQLVLLIEVDALLQSTNPAAHGSV